MIYNHAYHFYWLHFRRKNNTQWFYAENFNINGTELLQFDTFRRVLPNWMPFGWNIKKQKESKKYKRYWTTRPFARFIRIHCRSLIFSPYCFILWSSRIMSRFLHKFAIHLFFASVLVCNSIEYVLFMRPKNRSMENSFAVRLQPQC